jgi:hypothetical protein
VAGHRRRQEAGQLRHGQLRGGLAELVRGGHPAGAEHDRDVVPVGAGGGGERPGGVPRRRGARLGGIKVEAGHAEKP